MNLLPGIQIQPLTNQVGPSPQSYVFADQRKKANSNLLCSSRQWQLL